MGEPAGIGPELILKAWQDRASRSLPSFVVFGSGAILTERARRLGMDVPIHVSPVDNVGQAMDRARDALAVVDVQPEAAVTDTPGRPTPDTAMLTIAAIEQAVRAVHDGAMRAMVTCPIQKETLYHAGFDHPGHTEYLGALAEDLWGEPAEPVMMLASDELRTVPATVHIPLAEVPRALTADRLLAVMTVVHRDLVSRFGLAAPRLAICGLNPHAGEGGTIGTEDGDIIRPAIDRAVAHGIDATGPFPADTLFHARARRGYDAVIAMYHDQALIPIKTIAFDEAVNVTLGLPFMRTSPDHGTALDIAGTGRADPSSFLAALALADRLTREETAVKTTS